MKATTGTAPAARVAQASLRRGTGSRPSSIQVAAARVAAQTAAPPVVLVMIVARLSAAHQATVRRLGHRTSSSSQYRAAITSAHSHAYTSWYTQGRPAS